MAPDISRVLYAQKKRVCHLSSLIITNQIISNLPSNLLFQASSLYSPLKQERDWYTWSCNPQQTHPWDHPHVSWALTPRSHPYLS